MSAGVDVTIRVEYLGDVAKFSRALGVLLAGLSDVIDATVDAAGVPEWHRQRLVASGRLPLSGDAFTLRAHAGVRAEPLPPG